MTGQWTAVAAMAVALLAHRALGLDECSSKVSCDECLMEGEHSFCGWCSPGGIIYANGTKGARCGDERDDPWDCPQRYQTKKCPPDFLCNTTSGQCKPVPPGTAGAKNQSACAKSCHKKAKPSHHNVTKHHYLCDNSSATCQQTMTNGSKTFATISACNATCHKKKVPKSLSGYWRGIMISSNYTAGEYDFLFASGNVTITTPEGMDNASAGVTIVSVETSLNSFATLLFSFNSGPDAGKFRKAIYHEGPKGPETNETVLAMGPPFPTPDVATAPATFDAAMAGETNAVYMLRACLDDPGLACHWAGAPTPGLTEAETTKTVTPPSQLAKPNVVQKAQLRHEQDDSMAKARRIRAGIPGDPCNVKTNCSTCTGYLGGKQCGWCTAPVQYGNGSLMVGPNGPVHCAGFHADGTANPWTCSGLYMRGTCFDHICEVFPNYTAVCRHTKPGEVGTISGDKCATKCKPPAKIYSCNTTVGKCTAVPPGQKGAAQSVCAQNCTKHKPVPLSICNNDTLTCEPLKNGSGPVVGSMPTSLCAKMCQPRFQCAPNPNGTNLTCIKVAHSAPAFATAQPKAMCMAKCKTPPIHNCTPPVLQGTYRGIKISGDGTPHGEWDLKLGPCYAELKNSTGVVWKALVQTGGMSPITFILGSQGPKEAKEDKEAGRSHAESVALRTLQRSANGTIGAKQIIHALYTFENGPETIRFTLAMSAINGVPPKKWADVMPDKAEGLVLGMAKCLHDKPAPPVPGGTYCDPNANPPQNCPPYPGHRGSKCPKCAQPPCLCPGNYPPPPPAPASGCSFARAFTPPPPKAQLTTTVPHR